MTDLLILTREILFFLSIHNTTKVLGNVPVVINGFYQRFVLPILATENTYVSQNCT